MSATDAVTVLDRFWAKVSEGESCWQWTAATNGRGYGRFSHGPMRGQTHELAHRFAYEALVGPIPVGLTVDHLCENKRCVNPAHMELVTRAENTRRRHERERARRLAEWVAS